MEIECRRCSQRLRYPDALKNPLLRCPKCGTSFRVEPPAHDAGLAQHDPFALQRSQPREPLSTYAEPSAETRPLSPELPRNTPFATAPPESRPGALITPSDGDLVPDPYPPIRPPRPNSLSKTLSGMGWLVMIAVLLAFKAGPRIFKHFARERQQRNVPAQHEEQRQAAERIIRDLEQQMAAEKAARQGLHPEDEPAPIKFHARP